jgi:glycerol 2-dehydrogenase (NADP+)
VPPAVNQVEVHPFLPRHELLRACAMSGVAVQAYSPLGSSLGRGPALLSDPTVSRSK